MSDHPRPASFGTAPSTEAAPSCSPLVAWIDEPDKILYEPTSEASYMPALIFIGSGKRLEIAFHDADGFRRLRSVIDGVIQALEPEPEAEAPAAFDALTEAVTRERKRLEEERGKAPTPRELGQSVIEAGVDPIAVCKLWRAGYTVDGILDEHPQLTLEQVHAVIDGAYGHKEPRELGSALIGDES